MKKYFILVSLIGMVVFSSCENKRESFFPFEWGELVSVEKSSTSDDYFRNAEMVIEGDEITMTSDSCRITVIRSQSPVQDWRIDVNIPKGFFPTEWGELKYWGSASEGVDLVFENKTINIKNILGYVTQRHQEDAKLADSKGDDLAWSAKDLTPWPIIIERDGKFFCFSKYLEEEDFFYYTGENGIKGFYRINHDGTANMLCIGRGKDKGCIL